MISSIKQGPNSHDFIWKLSAKTKNKNSIVETHNQKGSDGLVHPTVLLKQVADHNTSAEESHEQIHGHNGSMIRSGQRFQFGHYRTDQMESHCNHFITLKSNQLTTILFHQSIILNRYCVSKLRITGKPYQVCIQ